MTEPQSALDRSDSRVRHDEGIGGAIRGFIDRVRSGDLGMLPVIVGLILIAVVMSRANGIFGWLEQRLSRARPIPARDVIAHQVRKDLAARGAMEDA